MVVLRRSSAKFPTIIVLEAPWQFDEKDINRTSVQPFVDGLAKYHEAIKVHYTRFYDLSGLKLALDELTRDKSPNTIIYVAAHGYKNEIHNEPLNKILFEIGELSNKRPDANINGVVLGSCFVGENVTTMKTYIEGTKLAWCLGYSASSEWFTGTLIDVAVMNAMLGLREKNLSSQEPMIKALRNAIAPFNLAYTIGEDYQGDAVSLRDALSVVIQPRGQGKQAKDISTLVVADK